MKSKTELACELFRQNIDYPTKQVSEMLELGEPEVCRCRKRVQAELDGTTYYSKMNCRVRPSKMQKARDLILKNADIPVKEVMELCELQSPTSVARARSQLQCLGTPSAKTAKTPKAAKPDKSPVTLSAAQQKLWEQFCEAYGRGDYSHVPKPTLYTWAKTHIGLSCTRKAFDTVLDQLLLVSST